MLYAHKDIAETIINKKAIETGCRQSTELKFVVQFNDEVKRTFLLPESMRVIN